MAEFKTYGELINYHLDQLNKLHKSMGYTVTEIIIATKEAGEPTIYSFADAESEELHGRR